MYPPPPLRYHPTSLPTSDMTSEGEAAATSGAAVSSPLYVTSEEDMSRTKKLKKDRQVKVPLDHQ